LDTTCIKLVAIREKWQRGLISYEEAIRQMEKIKQQFRMKDPYQQSSKR
jgi:hypothetical protein